MWAVWLAHRLAHRTGTVRSGRNPSTSQNHRFTAVLSPWPAKDGWPSPNLVGNGAPQSWVVESYLAPIFLDRFPRFLHFLFRFVGRFWTLLAGFIRPGPGSGRLLARFGGFWKVLGFFHLSFHVMCSPSARPLLHNGCRCAAISAWW